MPCPFLPPPPARCPWDQRWVAANPDLKGFVIQGLSAITSEMGDEAALKAMQGNEKRQPLGEGG